MNNTINVNHNKREKDSNLKIENRNSINLTYNNYKKDWSSRIFGDKFVKNNKDNITL